MGTEDGRILIYSSGKIIQTISVDLTEPKSNQSLIVPSAPVTSIESIINISRGFISASKGGAVGIYECAVIDEIPQDYHLKRRLPITDGFIRTMAVSSTEGNLLLELETNQVLRIGLVPTVEGTVRRMLIVG